METNNTPNTDFTATNTITKGANNGRIVWNLLTTWTDRTWRKRHVTQTFTTEAEALNYVNC